MAGGLELFVERFFWIQMTRKVQQNFKGSIFRKVCHCSTNFFLIYLQRCDFQGLLKNGPGKYVNKSYENYHHFRCGRGVIGVEAAAWPRQWEGEERWGGGRGGEGEGAVRSASDTSLVKGFPRHIDVRDFS